MARRTLKTYKVKSTQWKITIKKSRIKDVIKENVDDDIGLHRLTVIAKPQKKEHRTDLKKERGTTLVAREENEGGSARQTGW